MEGCRSLVLDINQVMRALADALRRHPRSDDAETRTYSLGFSWSWRAEPAPWAEVTVSLALHRDEGTATLRFDVDHRSLRTGPQSAARADRKHCMQIWRAALVVALPGNRPALRQAVLAQRRHAVPEPRSGSVPPRLCVAGCQRHGPQP